MLRRLPSNRVTCTAIITVVSVLVYYNTFDCGFVFDDHRAILTNDDLDASKTSLWRVFSNDFWGGSISRRESHKSYRPLTVLTFRYLNHMFAGLNPAGYHMVNVGLHAVASLLFYFAAEIILGCCGWWPCHAALLFATHSIHTEAVASVVGRAEVLCCIFFLLSFLVYSKAILLSHSHLASRGMKFSWTLVIISIALAACSLLSKEQGITVIGVCGVFDILLHWPLFVNKLYNMLLRKKYHQMQHEESDSNGTISNGNAENIEIQPASKQSMLLAVIGRITVLLVAGAVIMWFRLLMNGGGEPIFKKEEMRAAYHPDWSVRILSFCNIYSWNAWLLLTPSPLCCDWSLGSVPLVTSLTDTRNIYFLILIITIALLSVIVLSTNNLQRRVELGMSLALIVVTFFPASGIVFRVGFVIAERVLYLPSMGMCVLVVAGMRQVAKNKGLKTVVHCSIVYLVLIMSLKTWSRNTDWRSDLSLYESGVRVNSNNVKLLNNYAMELKSAGLLDESEKYYLKAMHLEPEYSDLFFNYGNLLSEQGDFSNAVKFFEKALSHPQTYTKTLNNLATTYYRLKRYKEAELRFLESLEKEPDQATTYNNLASLYGETKRFSDSERMFHKALKLNPTYVEAYFNLGTLQYHMGRVEEAEKNLKHALHLNPHHVGAKNNLHVIEYYRDKKKSS